jgi:hypothetical protein
MIRVLSLAVLAGGIVLLVMGINASNSFSSDVSRFITGNPSDRAMYLIGSGVVLAVGGLAGFAFGGGKKR